MLIHGKLKNLFSFMLNRGFIKPGNTELEKGWEPLPERPQSTGLPAWGLLATVLPVSRDLSPSAHQWRPKEQGDSFLLTPISRVLQSFLLAGSDKWPFHIFPTTEAGTGKALCFSTPTGDEHTHSVLLVLPTAVVHSSTPAHCTKSPTMQIVIMFGKISRRCWKPGGWGVRSS